MNRDKGSLIYTAILYLDLWWYKFMHVWATLWLNKKTFSKKKASDMKYYQKQK